MTTRIIVGYIIADLIFLFNASLSSSSVANLSRTVSKLPLSSPASIRFNVILSNTSSCSLNATERGLPDCTESRTLFNVL